MKRIFRIIIIFLISLVFLASCEFPTNSPKETFSLEEIVWETDGEIKAYAHLLSNLGNEKQEELQIKLVETKVFCEEEGYKLYQATYTDGTIEEVSEYRETLDPIGHDYELYQYSFSSDYSTVTAYFFCNNDSSHAVSLDFVTTSERTLDPTCTTSGLEIYYANFDFEGVEYDARTEVEVAPLGHDFLNGKYEIVEAAGVDLHFEVKCSHGCGETFSVPAVKISEVVHPTNEHGKFERVTYSGDYQNKHLEKIIETAIDDDKSFISGFNTFEETNGFFENEGLRLFTKDGLNANNRLHYLLIKYVDNKYEIVSKGYSVIDQNIDYDYAIVSFEDDLIYYNANELDLIIFDSALNNLSIGNVSIYFEAIASNLIHIDYDLGFELLASKDELYRSFFTDYYFFITEELNTDLSNYDIFSVDDFLVQCKNWDAYGRSEMAGLGNAFGRFFLEVEIGGSFATQPATKFVGWCYSQGKYIDFLHYLEVFFGYWRTDEGYVKNDPNGADFFASSWAAFVDTCKFFYFSSSTLTTKYKWFTIEKSARVHYMLDNAPQIGSFDLPNNEEGNIILPTELARDNYIFLGWYDDEGNRIEVVNKSMRVHAMWEHITRMITFVSNGEQYLVETHDGWRLPKVEVKNTNYQLHSYIDINGEEVDPLRDVRGDETFYLLWEKKQHELVTLRIYSLNTESATSEVSIYNGARMYQPNVSIDASLYWYKIAIMKEGSDFVISAVAASGEATPKNFDYLILIYSGDNTNSYTTITSSGIHEGQKVIFSQDPAALATGEINVTFSVVGGEDAFDNLILISDEKIPTYNQTQASQNLPTLIKNGYNFLGWYDQNDQKYSSVNFTGTLVLYARWEEKTYNDVMDYVSDVVTSYTLDQLPYEFNGTPVTWESTNTNLYFFDGNVGQTSRRYQTHQEQTVTIKAHVGSKTYSKTVTIAPVLYDTPTHPLATYFSVGSASSYTKYSTRYASTNELFSDKFKAGYDFVYYAFAIPNLDGTLSINETYIDRVMALKAYGIRVTFVIDGANSGALKNLVRVCDNQKTRATFIQNICNMLINYGFDGVDIDWEFPGTLSSQSGFEKYTTAVDIRNMNALLTELRAKMNEMQADGGTPYMLTVATPPTYWGTDRFDYVTINNTCDYVNMMSYDLNKTNQTSHLTHVHIPANNYSYQFSCEYGINYYSSLGLDKSKIILGAAGYGKAYKVTGTVNMNVTCPALGVAATLGQVQGYGLALQSVTWASGTIYYHGIMTLKQSGNFKEYTEYNNGKVVGSYLYSQTDKYFITYDSETSLIAKCDLAKQYPGMGIMMWAYGEDATDTITNTLVDNLG